MYSKNTCLRRSYYPRFLSVSGVMCGSGYCDHDSNKTRGSNKKKNVTRFLVRIIVRVCNIVYGRNRVHLWLCFKSLYLCSITPERITSVKIITGSTISWFLTFFYEELRPVYITQTQRQYPSCLRLYGIYLYTTHLYSEIKLTLSAFFFSTLFPFIKNTYRM